MNIPLHAVEIMGCGGQFHSQAAWGDSIVMIRADFQQGMESASLFKMNTATDDYWLKILTLSCGVSFSVTVLI